MTQRQVKWKFQKRRHRYRFVDIQSYESKGGHHIELEDKIAKMFPDTARFLLNHELFLPLTDGHAFISACSEQNIAIIGLEFFCVGEDFDVVPVDPIRGLDCSSLLKQNFTWSEIAGRCAELADEVLKEEMLIDSTEYFTPTLFEAWQRPEYASE